MYWSVLPSFLMKNVFIINETKDVKVFFFYKFSQIPVQGKQPNTANI